MRAGPQILAVRVSTRGESYENRQLPLGTPRAVISVVEDLASSPVARHRCFCRVQVPAKHPGVSIPRDPRRCRDWRRTSPLAQPRQHTVCAGNASRETLDRLADPPREQPVEVFPPFDDRLGAEVHRECVALTT